MEDNWIKVSDRLPEERKEVFVSIKFGDIIQAYRVGNSWRGSLDVRYNMKDCYAMDDRLICGFEDVGHWQPLPEPPK